MNCGGCGSRCAGRNSWAAADGTSDALLVEALLEPGALATLGIEGHSARRIARMIQAGRDAAGAPGGNAETVLWALWHSTGLASRWTDAALAGGVGRCPGRP